MFVKTKPYFRLMKRILFTRHAKSSWANAGMSDHDRPLNERGLSNAQLLSVEMNSEFEKVQEVYVSSAKRAQETAQHLNLNPAKMKTFKALYTFDYRALLNFIKEMDSSYNYIQIVGHNPAITEFVNSYSNARIDNVPTCGMVLIEWKEAEKWSEIEDVFGKLLMFNTPKRY